MRDLFRIGGSQYAVLLAQLVTGPLLARSMGLSERGVLATLLVVHLMMPVALGFGIVARFRSAAATRTNWEMSKGMLVRSVRTSAILSLTVVLVAWFLPGLGIEVRATATLLVLVTPFLVYRNAVLSAAVSLGDFGMIARNNCIQAALNLIVVPSLFLTNQLNLVSAGIFYAGLALVSTIAVLRWKWRAGNNNIIQPFQYGLKAYPGNLLEVSYGRIDQILVTLLLGATPSSLFAIAYSFATMVLPVLHARSLVLARTVGKVREDGRKQSLEKRSVEVGIWSVVLAICACVGAVVVAPFFIPIFFGSEYSSSVVHAQIMVAGVLFYGLALERVQRNLELGLAATNTIGFLVGVLSAVIFSVTQYPVFELFAFSIAFGISGITMFVTLVLLGRPRPTRGME